MHVRHLDQPIFEFAAQDGALLRGEAVSFGQKNRYPVGSQWEVLVESDKPEMVYMSNWNRLAIGVFMTVLGLGGAAGMFFAIADLLAG